MQNGRGYNTECTVGVFEHSPKKRKCAIREITRLLYERAKGADERGGHVVKGIEQDS